MIKRIRDLMRTDPGLNGDLDRLPQLSWMLFLKAFDDKEQEWPVERPDYQPLLQENYRWRTWAGNDRFTGEPLVEFINDDLLPRLRALGDTSTSADLASKIGHVFQGVENRMRSGYQIREVLNEINKVDFTSSKDVHAMAELYESMLQEVRDAAGDSGEFYTPRPLTKFIVQQVDPRPGETVLDPAAGTGGFLVETLEHLGMERAESVRERRDIERSIRGIEKKPLPYLLAMMNLILHGVDVPQVESGNALALLRQSASPATQVDVVVTNPPFGGAESPDVVKAFPKKYQTAETAWLFLTAILDKLKPGGRCGIVLPNGVLFGEGVGTRIKERLLKECNLHTVVRLPDGVFAPYTSIPSNLLFFEKRADGRKAEQIHDIGGWATRDVWFYEIVPPAGSKRYTKTKPMRFEEFAECTAWWGGRGRDGRVENDRAWMVSATQLHEAGFNLDVPNPSSGDDLAHRPPHELVKELIETEHEILAILAELQSSLEATR
ncbi:class I SAM-dependent DNA methyltransferase [Gandjariella thermophila]|uniref:class I SAM-dependent DNA methyltransferase n=1 Tax=Gandjariella thermophila TaxID=1931992 RepID=UPI001CEF78FB|nr:N-6 DNA methylase [Gandjariella thermophila]